MFKHMFQSDICEFNQVLQVAQMLVSDTSVFHQGLQKKATLFHILFWEMRNIDITRRALSA